MEQKVAYETWQDAGRYYYRFTIPGYDGQMKTWGPFPTRAAADADAQAVLDWADR